ncbi:MAG: carboxypeptidase regulatory-like domain-containing protein [Deltaproteobacteria bacterium]|nr:carboxypeptidase regulatory-like domain-containing protein [Deltaproteobacteria bacterium]
MKKWNLIIDVEKCNDCNNCFLSCKDEYVGNDFPPYSVAQPNHGHRWMNIMRKERGQYPKVDVAYLPTPCMHCDDAPCIKKSKDGAVYKRKDGIVIIDPEKAKGQKHLVNACPYGAIWWNEEKAVPQKCTLCAHLLDEGWKEPRCVQACPTGALRIVHVEDSEMQKIIESENLEVYQPQYKTRPRVYYKNLYLYTTCFIAGSVAVRDTDECAEGATVLLIKNSKKTIAEAVTNNYGDFKLDGLTEQGGQYRLEIAYPGYEKQVLNIELEGSMNLGTIFF